MGSIFLGTTVRSTTDNNILFNLFFKLLGFNAGTQVKFLHDVSIKLLDLVYILHEEIYTKLLLVATGETYRSVDHRHKLAVLASDFMLLACAIIAAAAFIVDEQASDGVCVSCVPFGFTIIYKLHHRLPGMHIFLSSALWESISLH